MSSDNQATALALVSRAEEFISLGRLHDARALLERSLSIYDTSRASDLIQRVEARIQRGEGSTPRPQPPPQQETPSRPTPSSSSAPPPRPPPSGAGGGVPPRPAPGPTPAPKPSSHSGPQPSTSSSSAGSTGSTASSGPRSNSSAPPPGAAYTADEQALARRIVKITCKYEVLGVARTADDAAIKTAYRKLAMRVHPDRNKAPEAEEAFKVVTAAHDTLSDPKRRRMYDMTGADDEASLAAQQHARQSAAYARARGGGGGMPHGFQGFQYGMHGGGFEDDFVTPDMLFSMLFGGRPRQRGPARRGPSMAGQQQQQQQQFHRQQQQRAGAAREGEGVNFMQFLHFVPLVLLFLFTLFNMSSSGDVPSYPYSLSKTHSYSIPRHTQQGAPFFVNNQFQWTYGRDPRALGKFEAAVNEDYSVRLQKECGAQRRAKSEKLEAARAVADGTGAAKLKAAYAEPMPACDAYDKFMRKKN